MHRSFFIGMLGFSLAVGMHAGVLGQKLPELQMSDGTVLKNVTPLSYSPEKHTVAVAIDRAMREIPLSAFPPALQTDIVAEQARRPKPRDVPVAAPAPAKPSATVRAEPPAVRDDGETLSPEVLMQKAAAAAPTLLEYALRKRYERMTPPTCKIESTAEVPGWNRIRVAGLVSYFTWPPDAPVNRPLSQQEQEELRRSRHYQTETAKFEMEFEVGERQALKLSNISVNNRQLDLEPNVDPTK
jgi:hypothetical protein